jgi:hypothetical protein
LSAISSIGVVLTSSEFVPPHRLLPLKMLLIEKLMLVLVLVCELTGGGATARGDSSTVVGAPGDFCVDGESWWTTDGCIETSEHGRSGRLSSAIGFGEELVWNVSADMVVSRNMKPFCSIEKSEISFDPELV